MTSLYIFIKYLTFPGALVRCMWEQIVCRICKVPVEDNRYLRKDEMISHVEHEFMPKAQGAFAICFVPAFMNFIGALFLCLAPIMFTLYIRIDDFLLTLVNAAAYWFAFSLMINSYPLIEDAYNMMEKIYKQGNILQKILYAPAAAFLFVGAYAEKYCITFILGAALTAGIILI
ncbi:MAG: hypothetical protein IKV21_01070 [Clostridia bacterium]|nr:hypothetical protein [Clostridia bacterium]